MECFEMKIKIKLFSNLALSIVGSCLFIPMTATAKNANPCDKFYVGQQVYFLFQTEIGDFWLGYKTKVFTGKGIILGMSKTHASIRLTNDWDRTVLQTDIKELSCKEISNRYIM